MKKVFLVIFSAVFGLFSWAEEILFQSDFSMKRELAGWTDVWQKNPPNAEMYKIVSDEEGGFLRMSEKMFGLSHGLSHPVIVNDKLRRITFRAVLRQPRNIPAGYQMAIALSSRATVARDAGQAFWKGRDSGVLVCGYTHNLQSPNYVAYQLEGRQIRTHRPFSPFGLLKRRDVWNTWTVCYDNEKKEIRFYNAPDSASPYVTLYKADLSGIVLSSLWIAAWGAEYRSITVSCEMK